MLPAKKLILSLYIVAALFVGSCTRNSIDFGVSPQNGYTNLEFVDTIGVSLSTVVYDSFSTNGATGFLVGRYKDPYLGIISARPFFQLTIPASVTDIAATAQYDSAVFVFKLNHYYYGDTTVPETIYVNELASPITYSYNSKLYNTSTVPIKSAPLAKRSLRFSPNGNDSIVMRIDDNKGLELFTKLRQQSLDVTNADNFLNYFKGISIGVDNADSSAVYGLSFGASAMFIRVFYHNTFPYPDAKYIDFASQANTFAFNQLLTDRSGTGINLGPYLLTEVPGSITNNAGYMQSGAGVYLKAIFPSLRTIIAADKTVKLLKAELIIRPAYFSYDNNKYKLPGQLYFNATDESNSFGSQVMDSTGTTVLHASPVIDELYGQNTYYRVNITNYINQLLNTAGSEDQGFFITQSSTTPNDITRLIMNNSLHGLQGSKLLLHLVTIKN